MSIKNINNIQKSIVEKINNSISNENSVLNEIDTNYLLQSILNMGQRIGVRGDGIVYNNFALRNILDIPSVDAKYVIYDSNRKFEFYNSKNEKIVTNETKSISNELTALEFNDYKIINNIEKYYANYIDINGNKLYNLSFGKILGSKNKYDVEIIYNIYDVDSNILLEGFRSYYLYSDGISSYYILFYFSKKEQEAIENTNNNEYEFTFYIISSSRYSDSEKQILEDCYNGEKFGDSIVFQDLVNNYNKDVKYSDLFLLFKDYDINNSNITLSETIQYNNNNNIGFYISKNDKEIQKLNNIDNELSKSLNGNSVAVRLYFLNNDINYMYSKLLELYNNSFITGESINKYIINEIYNHLVSTDYDASRDNDTFYLCIPLDYVFNYQCNSNSLERIYNSDNNFINFTSTKNDIYNFNEDNEIINNNIYIKYNGVDKIKNIYYEVIYNALYNDFATGIKIIDLYTLPYINLQNNWNINDSDSKISAVGKNAGNPNIIILYNYYDSIKDEVVLKIISETYQSKLSELNNDLYEGKFEFNPYECGITNDMSNNNYNQTCKYKLFKINESNIDFLSYAFIILISDKSCIVDNKYENDGYITTFWTIDNNAENAVPQFKYINNNIFNSNDNSVLSLVSLLNVRNITEIDKEYTLKTIESVNSVVIYNENDGKLNNSLLSINKIPAKNIKSNISYIDYDYVLNDLTYVHHTESENEYTNNNGLTVSINFDKIQNNDNSDVLNSRSFLLKENLLELKVYSELYPIYSVTAEQKNYNKVLVNSLIITDQSVVDKEINYTEEYAVNTVEEMQLRQTAQVTAVNESVNTKALTYEVIYKPTSKYYNEYVFSSNVPSMTLSSIFLQDVNTLNRVNIISLDKKANLYNSYIGTSFDNDDKETLIIGTSNENINVNKSYLVSYNNSKSFKKQTNFKLNFDNINIGHKNSTVKIEDTKLYLTHENNSCTYYTLGNKYLSIYNIMGNRDKTDDLNFKYYYNEDNVAYIKDSFISDKMWKQTNNGSIQLSIDYSGTLFCYIKMAYNNSTFYSDRISLFTIDNYYNGEIITSLDKYYNTSNLQNNGYVYAKENYDIKLDNAKNEIEEIIYRYIKDGEKCDITRLNIPLSESDEDNACSINFLNLSKIFTDLNKLADDSTKVNVYYHYNYGFITKCGKCKFRCGTSGKYVLYACELPVNISSIRDCDPNREYNKYTKETFFIDLDLQIIKNNKDNIVDVHIYNCDAKLIFNFTDEISTTTTSSSTSPIPSVTITPIPSKTT